MVSAANYTHFDFIYSLYMHPDSNSYLLYEPMDTADFQPIFEQLLARKSVFIYSVDNQPVGMFKLLPFTHRSSHVVYLGGVAIDSAHTGKGFGVKMMEAIIDYCRQKGFLRIELSVAVTNEKAIHVYEKAGFIKEGILRKYTHLKKEDIYVDEALYSYLIE